MHSSSAKFTMCDIKCTKTYALVVLSLIMITSGFVLTVMSWLGQTSSESNIATGKKAARSELTSVQRIRVAGPAVLTLGTVLLIVICMYITFIQGQQEPADDWVAKEGQYHHSPAQDAGRVNRPADDVTEASTSPVHSSPNSPLLLREARTAVDKIDNYDVIYHQRRSPEKSQTAKNKATGNFTPSMMRKHTVAEAYAYIEEARKNTEQSSPINLRDDESKAGVKPAPIYDNV